LVDAIELRALRDGLAGASGGERIWVWLVGQPGSSSPVLLDTRPCRFRAGAIPTCVQRTRGRLQRWRGSSIRRHGWPSPRPASSMHPAFVRTTTTLYCRCWTLRAATVAGRLQNAPPERGSGTSDRPGEHNRAWSRLIQVLQARRNRQLRHPGVPSCPGRGRGYRSLGRPAPVAAGYLRWSARSSTSLCCCRL
jgi:hypothetical protein